MLIHVVNRSLKHIETSFSKVLTIDKCKSVLLLLPILAATCVLVDVYNQQAIMRIVNMR